MRTEWRRRVLWLWVVSSMLFSFALVDQPIIAGASPTAVLSVDPIKILDKTLTPGESFYVEINIANVEDLWGFEFFLFYNTTILTATNASSYDPFTTTLFATTNETQGYVYRAFSMLMGTKVGFSTTDATLIARVDFTVDANGTSSLSLKGTKLSTPEAGPIDHDAFDGFFANVEIAVHDIAITDVTAPTTVAVDSEATVTVTAENLGESSETFNVSLYYDETLIETKLDVTLSAGESRTLTFTWNTTGVADGTYTLKVVASLHPDEVDTMNNTVYSEVTVGEEAEEETSLDFTPYIIAAAAIVIALATLAYVFKLRKKK